MRILVTGGAGFIGSHLCEYLVRDGHSVTVIDDLSSGYLMNLEGILAAIDFRRQKVEDFDFEEFHDINAVVHLAAQVSVPISISRFGASSSSNLRSTVRVLEFCRSKSIPLVYASSSAVYGDLERGNDESEIVDLLSPYATDKYVSELYAEVAHKRYGLSSVGLRFFNVYGPRQDPSNAYSGVISIFSNRLLADKNIVIKGGFQTRDFVYVGDVVHAIATSIVIACQRSLSERINVLTGRSISIDEIADMLIEKIGGSGQKNYENLPAGDPVSSCGTTAKMESILGVERQKMVAIVDGLSLTVDSIR